MTFHYEVVQASVLQLAAYRLCLGYATPNLHVFHFMYIYIYIYIYILKKRYVACDIYIKLEASNLKIPLTSHMKY